MRAQAVYKLPITFAIMLLDIEGEMIQMKHAIMTMQLILYSHGTHTDSHRTRILPMSVASHIACAAHKLNELVLYSKDGVRGIT